MREIRCFAGGGALFFQSCYGQKLPDPPRSLKIKSVVIGLPHLSRAVDVFTQTR